MNELIEISGFWVPKNSNREFVKFLTMARETGRRIRVYFKPGKEEWHRYSTKNLNSFTCLVGRSMGTKQILLVLNSVNSKSGDIMTTSSDSIQSWQFA